MIEYKPQIIRKPEKVLENVGTAWVGLESIIEDIVNRFNIERKNALEFGVENGYSTVAISNFFEKVVGVDTFVGDVHAGQHTDNFQEVKNRLAPFQNIELVQSDYKDFIKTHNLSIYDFIHIDIVHTFDETYECGRWAIDHSKIVIFHDTLSFPDVNKAVGKIAEEKNITFYNYPNCHGLGILVNE